MQAVESAQALHALAYAVSPHIVFAAERYAPDRPEGLRLLAHELTHIIQQTRAGTAPDRIDPAATLSGQGVNLPPVQVPGTALTLLPGPLELTQLQGLRLPLPTSLRLTNALGLGPGPTFVLDLSPRLLVGTILDNVDLSVIPLREPRRKTSLIPVTRIASVSFGRSFRSTRRSGDSGARRPLRAHGLPASVGASYGSGCRC